MIQHQNRRAYMKADRKTASQTYQKISLPVNFWKMLHPKGFGFLWELKWRLCNAGDAKRTVTGQTIGSVLCYYKEILLLIQSARYCCIIVRFWIIYIAFIMSYYCKQAREDPMCGFVAKKTEDRREKYERVRQLMAIMEEIREEERERKMKKKMRKRRRRCHE